MRKVDLKIEYWTKNAHGIIIALLLEAIYFKLFGGAIMTNGTLAILDSDIDYLHHLSEYLRARDDFPYDIVVFNNMDSLHQYTHNYIDILITSTISDYTENKNIGNVFYLSEEPVDSYKDFLCIYKYQSADMILRILMEHCQNRSGNVAPNHHCSVIGIYSPVNRCGKTSLAMSLGYILSEHSSTLLISFDLHSFLHTFVDTTSHRDISDLLFYYREDPENLKNKLLTLTYKFYELSFLCPPSTPCHIKDIDSNVWYELLDTVSKLGLYKYIILDFSALPTPCEEIFVLCDKIFVPYFNDYTSSSKIDSFFDYLSCSYNLDKTSFNKVQLPMPDILADKPSFVNWITAGELVSFSRKLLSNIPDKCLEVSYVNAIL